MILYSIIPIDIVFSKNGPYEGKDMVEMEYMGQKIQASPLTDNQYVIVRLISTSPKAFLNPALQPGTVIRSTK